LDEVLCALQKLRRLLPAASVRDGANVGLIAYLWVFSVRSSPGNKKQTQKQYVDFFVLETCVGPWNYSKQAVRVEMKIRRKYQVPILLIDNLL
jgi:hypothetical protein